ncbi:MAG: polysaccharide biosynthesis protein [Rikenellaceae bacterium]|nr:polysaccharide biosynthesis protein [Rikenellaceae bacterium]
MGLIGKLAGQTAIYGISSIVVRMLSYLLFPYYTHILGTEQYGVVTDIYALIPFALVVLTMGMESSYFRFAGKTDEAGKRHLFATTWGITSLAAGLFAVVVILLRTPIGHALGEVYVEQPLYIVLMALIVMFDVWATIPFSRLREQGRAVRFVTLKIVGIVIQVALAFAFGEAGLYQSEFGVGWVFVANLASSVVAWLLILPSCDGVLPKVDWAQLRVILAYSMPLLIGGVAGTAGEFLDRQLIKWLTPGGEAAFAELGIYGAVTKIAVVMLLFTQMYRLAAEPFFLSNFRKEEFVETNAAALKYYVMVSMAIFLGIALFKDVFALLAGPEFREGVYILPVILIGHLLAGVWLNLSFWYKREEKTRYAIYVTFAGVAANVVANVVLIPRLGYYGAAWARLISEAVMVAISWWLNRKYFPTPYQWGRIGEYVVLGLVLYFACSLADDATESLWVQYGVSIVALGAYALYAGWRERLFEMIRHKLKK